MQDSQGFVGCFLCQLQQQVWIDTPVGLDRAGEMWKRVGLQTNANHASQFCFHDRGASAAERIQHCAARRQIKLRKILSHQMRRIRKNEAIPVVEGAVLRPDRVFRSVGWAGGAWLFWEERKLLNCDSHVETTRI